MSREAEGTLTREEARAVYDRIAGLQDSQRFYEDAAVRELLRHSDFQEAHSVLEFGCGTGRHARNLLRDTLRADARYLAMDQSPAMIELSRKRLSSFGERVEIRLTDGAPKLDLPDASADRVLSTYVLDLLSHADIEQFISEAHRVLRPEGRLCLVSLTPGRTFFERSVGFVFKSVFRLSPGLIGGCRAVELMPFLPEDRWRLLYRSVVSPIGISSEVIVARPLRREAAES